MFAVAWSLPMLSYGAVGRCRLAVTLGAACYANWVITVLKAALHVSGVDASADPVNNAVFGSLTLLVVLPSVAAGGAWVLGFRRARG